MRNYTFIYDLPKEEKKQVKKAYIKSYEKTDQGLKIKHLRGSEIVPNTKLNYRRIEDTMEQQAESVDFIKLIDCKDFPKFLVTFFSILGVSIGGCGFFSFLLNFPIVGITFTAIGISSLLTGIASGIALSLKYKKALNDLSKNRKYLKNKHAFQSYNSKNLTNSKSISKKTLNLLENKTLIQNLFINDIEKIPMRDIVNMENDIKREQTNALKPLVRSRIRN